MAPEIKKRARQPADRNQQTERKVFQANRDRRWPLESDDGHSFRRNETGTQIGSIWFILFSGSAKNLPPSLFEHFVDGASGHN